jgi:di/tricarboxylate transporter
VVRARTGAAAPEPSLFMVQAMRLSVLTLVVMVLVGALLWLRGAPWEGLVLIAAAIPLAWWSNRRRCDAAPER